MRRHQSRQDYATQLSFKNAVVQKFGMPSFDLAAGEENRFVEMFFSQKDNALVQPWHQIGGLLWLNPPFGNIEPWAAKCRYESERGARILFLVPASVGAIWFANHVHRKAMVFALTPRLSFDGIAPFPKDCILAYYSSGAWGFDVWAWK